MGRHLGIDFLWFLVDFWRQVGEENGAKIDPRRHRKSDGKVDSVKIAKKLQQAVTTLCETEGSRALGRSPPIRRVSPRAFTLRRARPLKSSKVL